MKNSNREKKEVDTNVKLKLKFDSLSWADKEAQNTKHNRRRGKIRYVD